MTTRIVSIITLGVILVAFTALIAVFLLRGGSPASSGIAALVSYISVVLGLLGVLVQQQVVVHQQTVIRDQQADIQQKINGHLAAHVDEATKSARAEQDPRPPGG